MRKKDVKTSGKDGQSGELQRFTDLGRKLFAVPKSEVGELEKAAKAKHKSRAKKKIEQTGSLLDRCEREFIHHNIGAEIRQRFEYNGVSVLIFWGGQGKGAGQVYGYVLVSPERGPLEAWGNSDEAEAEQEAKSDIDKVGNGSWKLLR